jgi:uncharacterized protein YggE
MKRIFVLFLAFTFWAVLSNPCLGVDNETLPRLINVSGEAEVKVVPDEVILTLGVETWNKDLNLAKELNDERVQKILALANLFKIDSKDVQTGYIAIEPRYDEEYNKKNFIGFFVRKDIVITLKDISKFEDLLSGSLNAGAYYVRGIQFRATELRKYRDQARKLAIKAAREKATMLAEELGERVGAPYSITEQPDHWYSGYDGWRNSRSGLLTQNVIQNAGDPANASLDALAPGQISIRAAVSVSFQLVRE